MMILNSLRGFRGRLSSLEIPIQPVLQTSSCLSPPRGSGDTDQHQAPLREGVSGDFPGSCVFVPAWNLGNYSRLSVRANPVEFAQRCL